MEARDFDKFLKKAERLGATEVEIVAGMNEEIELASVKDKINFGKFDRKYSVGIRAVIGKRIGIAGGTVESDDDIMKLVEKAVKVAKVSPEDPDWNSLPRGLGKVGGVKIYDEKVDELEAEEMIEALMLMISKVKEKEGVFPIEAGIRTSKSFSQILNSYGEEVYASGTAFGISLWARSKESGNLGSYSDYQISRRYSDLSPEELAERVAERAKDSLNAKKIETGKYEVIFEGKIGGVLLSSVLFPVMSAENVQKNRSPLKGKLGEKILSEKISFLEDPHRSWDLGSRPFDGEGKKTKKYYLVKEGILSSYYYDDYTAKKEGKESTGNAHRSISSRPSPWINNVIFEPGDSDIEEMIQETKRGILVCSSIGYWLSNPMSGQMTGTISHGYLIEHGEIVGSVKGMTFADNVYSALSERIEMIGRELVKIGEGEFPPYKISGMTLAGE